MNNFNSLINANYVDHYYAGSDNPVSIPILKYDLSIDADIMQYNSTLQFKNLSLIAYRYANDEPGFVLIKLVKYKDTEKLVFRLDSEVLFELPYYDIIDGIKVFKNSYHHLSLLRIEYVIDAMTKPAEIYIHEKSPISHKKDSKYVNYEINNNDFIEKHVVDTLFDSNSSQVVNSNLIDKSMKLIYLGNLINDRNNMR